MDTSFGAICTPSAYLLTRNVCVDSFIGHSACPDVPMSAELFAGQCAELLYKLNIHAKVHVVGFSMGGAIAQQV